MLNMSLMSPARSRFVFIVITSFLAIWPGRIAAQQPASSIRPLRICLVSASAEYKSDESLIELQKFIEGRFNADCTRVFGTDKGKGIPGLEGINSFDVMVLFTRRIVLPEDQLTAVKKYIAAGKPIVGIRTASHAFENFLQ